MTHSELLELWKSAQPFDPDRKDCQPLKIYFQKRRLSFDANDSIIESVRLCHDAQAQEFGLDAALTALVALKNRNAEIRDCLRLTFDSNGNKTSAERILGTNDEEGLAIQTLPAERLTGLCVDFSSGITLTNAYKFPVWAVPKAENLSKFSPPKYAKCFVLFSGARGTPESEECLRLKSIWEEKMRGIFVPVFFLPQNTKTWSEFYLRMGEYMLPSVRLI
jgi:hypothetical protein